MFLHSLFMYIVYEITVYNIAYICMNMYNILHYLCTLYMNSEYKHIIVQIHLML